MSFSESLTKIVEENRNHIIGKHSSWERVRLGDIAEILNGYPFESDKFSSANSGTPLIRIRDILSNCSETFFHGEYEPEFMVQAGDLLVGMDGDFNSSVWRGKPGLLNQRCCKITLVSTEYESRFLAYCLPGYLSAINAHTSAITVKHLSSRTISDIPLPLPPRSEQRRIADKLDELLSDLDAGVSALERLQAKIKKYRAAVLKAAVEGKLVPKQKAFPIRRIGDAIESLGQGWSPKCEGRPSNDFESWAVIKTTAIQPLLYLEEYNKQLPASLKPRPHLELMEGDLLITRAGPRTRVGITCLIKRTRPRLMLCDKAYRLRCKKDTLSAAFLEVVLNAPHIVAALDKLKTGINDSGLNLTQDRFSELLVPFPTPDEQEAIVEAVENQFSVIEHLEADFEAKLKSASALRQSILRHAFTGELVPQNPKDESSAELLKRIATQHEEIIRQTKAVMQKKPKVKATRKSTSTNSKNHTLKAVNA